MSAFNKLTQKILNGKSDNNIDFNDLRKFILHFGFEERIKGSHHIFTKDKIEEIINIQPSGNKAKTYQVKQVRQIIFKYKLYKNDD